MQERNGYGKTDMRKWEHENEVRENGYPATCMHKQPCTNNYFENLQQYVSSEQDAALLH